MNTNGTGFLYLLVVALILLVVPAQAQLSEGGVPLSSVISISAEVPEVVMPEVDIQRLRYEDSLEFAKGIPFRFGYGFEVSYSMENSGKWEILPNGYKIWRLKISCPTASSINFTYRQYWLPEGARFYIYNPQKTQILGAFTARNNKYDGLFGTGILRGETAILEYIEPVNTARSGKIELMSVVHGYRDIFKEKVFSDDFGTSGSCNINVNCPQGADWQNEKRGAAMILTAGGTRWCSGSMINNARQDLKPYFLTANHCIDGSSSTWVFMFRYESPSCTNIDGPLNYTLSGSSMLARNAASDFALLQISEAPPDSFRVHWAGWNRADVPATSGVGIHHPDGDIKKISFVFVPFENDTWSGTPANSHWRTRWSSGVTEPGSSGSPIYNQNHQIVGQLHGGPSSCTATDKSDLYGKFSMSWDYGTTPATRLKDWLDPDNSGVLSVPGWDPTLGNPDTVAPTRITNLAVQTKTSSTIMLSWTAPLDTSYGGVVGYDIRVSNNPITDTTTFNAARKVMYVGNPKPAGQSESTEVDSLAFRTKYYFAVRSNDFWRNRSLISNIASDTTLFAPLALVTPASINKTVQAGQVIKDTIRIKNNSANPSTLKYRVELANNSFPTGKIDLNVIPVANNEPNAGILNDKSVNPADGGQSIDGQGGPDSGRYKWIDSDEPNGPQYVWQDIASTGTLVTTWTPTGSFAGTDEGFAGPFSLGFNFKYYGQVKNQIFVSSNGVVLFAAPTANMFSNATIPTAATPNDIICAFWDDLDGSSGGTVHTKQDGNRFIVQFTDWKKYSATTSALTFQIHLYANGRIMIYYNNMNATLTSATVGIENGTGTTGLQVVKDAAYIHNSLAVKFSADPEWLTTGNAVSGTLGNGNTAAVEITFRAEDYPAGNYAMDVKVSTNDPAHALVTVPVQMTLQAIPVELTSFSAEANGRSVSLQWGTATETNNKGFTIERLGNSTESWSSIGFVAGKGTTTEKSSYQFIDKSVSFGKYKYRLRQTDFDGTTKTYNSIEVDVALPSEFALHQNYPNPFNPSTAISFSLPEAAFVTISLYNATGELIGTLQSGTLEAGIHSVSFNAEKLPSGIYYYRMDSAGSKGRFSDTKKMMLVR